MVVWNHSSSFIWHTIITPLLAWAFNPSINIFLTLSLSTLSITQLASSIQEVILDAHLCIYNTRSNYRKPVVCNLCRGPGDSCRCSTQSHLLSFRKRQFTSFHSCRGMIIVCRMNDDEWFQTTITEKKLVLDSLTRYQTIQWKRWKQIIICFFKMAKSF